MADGETILDRAGLRVAVGVPQAQFVLHCEPSDAAALATRAQVALSPAMLRTARTDGWRALHLAPDEWLLIGPRDDADALAARLREASEPHSLVEVGERTRHLVLQGSAAPTLLATACPLDLRPSAFPPGACTRTLFGKTTVVLEREPDDCFRMHYGRSFGGYMVELIRAAAQDLPGTRPT